MTNIFMKILSMSLIACYVILAILIIRLFLRKAPKKYSYALWIAAAFRLCCPFSFESLFSLFNFGGRSVPQMTYTVADNAANAVVNAASSVTSAVASSVAPAVTSSVTPAVTSAVTSSVAPAVTSAVTPISSTAASVAEKASVPLNTLQVHLAEYQRSPQASAVLMKPFIAVPWNLLTKLQKQAA